MNAEPFPCQNELAVQLNKISSYFDYSPDAVFVESIDGRVLSCNKSAEKIFDYSHEELLAMRAHDLVPGDVAADLKEMSPDFSDSLRLGSSLHIESLGKRRDGSLFPTDVTIFPQSHLDFACFFVIVRDCTSKRENEAAKAKYKQQLQQIKKIEELGRMVSLLSSDFNNILTGIMSCASLLSRELPAGSSSAGKIQRIIDSAGRGGEVVRQLMAFTGMFPSIFQRVSLNKLVNDLRGLLVRIFPSNVECIINFDDDLPECLIDIPTLKEAISSICKNSAEALEADKPAKIRVEAFVGEKSFSGQEQGFWGTPLSAGRYICLRIIDSGCGMPERDLLRVFNPFFSTKPSNRGIGMISVLSMLRGHRGSALVESKVGAGTTVSLFLPIEKKSADCGLEPEKPVLQPAQTPGRLLVIGLSGDFALTTSLAESMSPMGYKVATAEGFNQGLDIFKTISQYLDAVVIDAEIPDAEPQKLVQEIHWLNPSVSIILCTSSLSEVDRIEFMNLGVLSFLSRPYTRDDLEGALVAAKRSNKY